MGMGQSPLCTNASGSATECPLNLFQIHSRDVINEDLPDDWLTVRIVPFTLYWGSAYSASISLYRVVPAWLYYTETCVFSYSFACNKKDYVKQYALYSCLRFVIGISLTSSPTNAVGRITYIVLVQTLNHAQSINHQPITPFPHYYTYWPMTEWMVLYELSRYLPDNARKIGNSLLVAHMYVNSRTSISNFSNTK